MDFKRVDVEKATAAVRLLLEELDLEEYRFSVGMQEPKSDVRVEYAASDGWRTMTLTVPDSMLLNTRFDAPARHRLAGEWRQKLRHARRRVDAREDRRAEATALGRAWADEKAESLRDRVAAVDWPDFWEEESNGALPIDIVGEQRGEMLVSASRAAHDRWRELRSEQVRLESIEESDTDRETAAAQLEVSLRPGLPAGISSARDGTGVYLRSGLTDREQSVASLRDAALVIEDWTEDRGD